MPVNEVLVTPRGLSLDGAEPHWTPFAESGDPLVECARAFVAARNPRLPRLDRATLSALVAVHLLLEDGADPGALFVAADDGCAAADRAYWTAARSRGGADASPLLFASTLPSAVAGEIAMTFALRGPCVVVAGAGATSVPAIRTRRGDDRPCLHVRVRGWGADGDGESLATLVPAIPPSGNLRRLPDGRG